MSNRFPLFVTYDATGTIVAMHQPGLCNRFNFRMVYGIARSGVPSGGRIDIVAIVESKL